MTRLRNRLPSHLAKKRADLLRGNAAPTPEEDKAVFEEIQRECPWYTSHLHSNWRTGRMRKRRRDARPPARLYAATPHAPDTPTNATLADAGPGPALTTIHVGSPGQLFMGSDATKFVLPPKLKWMTPNTTIEEVRRRAAADGVSGAVYFQAWEVAAAEPSLPLLAPRAHHPAGSLQPWLQSSESPDRYFPANMFNA
ncbi:hypothetical protein C8Q79DRAFT_1011114 [Trametes meyenii]|nr:hypothetical protein C8Q79DRAFT_1011114 [Trametes meyenii]